MENGIYSKTPPESVAHTDSCPTMGWPTRGVTNNANSLDSYYYYNITLQVVISFPTRINFKCILLRARTSYYYNIYAYTTLMCNIYTYKLPTAVVRQYNIITPQDGCRCSALEGSARRVEVVYYTYTVGLQHAFIYTSKTYIYI